MSRQGTAWMSVCVGCAVNCNGKAIDSLNKSPPCRRLPRSDVVSRNKERKNKILDKSKTLDFLLLLSFTNCSCSDYFELL